MFHEILDKQIEENGEVTCVYFIGRVYAACITHSNFRKFRLELYNGSWTNIWSYGITEKHLRIDISYMLQTCMEDYGIGNAPNNMMIDFLLHKMEEKELSNAL